MEHESLDGVKPDDIHVMAGSPSTGEILCYAVIEAPLDAPPGVTLRTRERPLLPVEQVHGWGIFNRLPILPDLPLNKIRELGAVREEPALPGHGRSGRARACRGVRGRLPSRRRRSLARARGDRRRLRGGDREAEHGLLPRADGRRSTARCRSRARAGWLFPRYQYRTVFPFACLASDASLALPRLQEVEAALERSGKLGLLSLMRLRGDKPTCESALRPRDGLTELAEAELPQKGVPMADRREQREAGDRLRETELFGDLSEAEATVLATFLERVEHSPAT